MKRNAIVRIVLFSIALLVLLSILGVGLAADRFVFLRNAFEEHADGNDASPLAIADGTCTTSFDPSDIRDIEIAWASGNIIIQPDKSATQIIVTEPQMTKQSHQMYCWQSGGTLKIEYCEEDFHLIGINEELEKDLTITVPANWRFEELEIDAASANVTVSDLAIENVDFDGASGICTFTSCYVSDMEVDTASGDIRFDGRLDRFKCSAMSASCQLTLNNHPRNIEVDSMSGDLDLTLPEDCGFTVAMDTLSSDFSSDFQTTISNGHHVHGDGSCRINVDAMSGDVTIRKGTTHHDEHH